MPTVEHLITNTRRQVEKINPDKFACEIRNIICTKLGTEISGISDFIHSNPIVPSREITGLIRCSRINDYLKSEGKPHLLNVIYDTPLPKSELLREKGGIGTKIGFVNHTIRMIGNDDVPYFCQKGNKIDIRSICKKVSSKYDIQYPSEISQSIKLLTIWNNIITKNLDNSALEIIEFKSTLWQEVIPQVKDIIQSHDYTILLSDLLATLPTILNTLTEQGIKWWQIPTKKALLKVYKKGEGEIEEVYCLNDMPYFKYSLLKTSKWDFLECSALNECTLAPCVELYVLCFLLMPQYFHYGNLYNKHLIVEEWLRKNCTINRDVVRLNTDGFSSIPIATVLATCRNGLKKFQSYMLDSSIYNIDTYRKAAYSAAENGVSQLTPVNFNNHFIRVN
ncbi:MAG: hypothetical protein R2800_03505 [Flavipsychrobacter sp.]